MAKNGYENTVAKGASGNGGGIANGSGSGIGSGLVRELRECRLIMEKSLSESARADAEVIASLERKADRLASLFAVARKRAGEDGLPDAARVPMKSAAFRGGRRFAGQPVQVGLRSA